MTQPISTLFDHSARFSELLTRCDQLRDQRTSTGADSAYSEGDELAPVLELASVALVMSVCGDAMPSPGRAFEHFAPLKKTFMDLVIASDDEDALLMMGLLSAAEAALKGELKPARLPEPWSRPSEASIVAMLRLKPSELAAGEVALALLADPEHTAQVRTLVTIERGIGAKSVLRAAKSAIEVRGPSSGRSVHRDDDAGFELVLFAGSPRELAVYGPAQLELSVIGAGFTEHGRTGGYLIGTLDTDISSLELSVSIGEETYALRIELNA